MSKTRDIVTALEIVRDSLPIDSQDARYVELDEIIRRLFQAADYQDETLPSNNGLGDSEAPLSSLTQPKQPDYERQAELLFDNICTIDDQGNVQGKLYSMVMAVKQLLREQNRSHQAAVQEAVVSVLEGLKSSVRDDTSGATIENWIAGQIAKAKGGES